MKPRTYTTPAAFKAALDQRLRNVAEPGIGITRRRQLLVFDRYLARLVRVLGDGDGGGGVRVAFFLDF